MTWFVANGVLALAAARAPVDEPAIGDAVVERRDDGIWIRQADPKIHVLVSLLRDADFEHISLDEDVLTLHTKPKPVRYRVLGRDAAQMWQTGDEIVVICELVDDLATSQTT